MVKLSLNKTVVITEGVANDHGMSHQPYLVFSHATSKNECALDDFNKHLVPKISFTFYKHNMYIVCVDAAHTHAHTHTHRLLDHVY